jgi:DNA anti-recombination protein RmuC
VGAVGGTLAGGAWDISRAGVDAGFLNEVSAKLTPGKWAVVSEISEEWVTPVDSSMVVLGGTVFRVDRPNVVREQHAKDVAATKAEIAKLKTKQAKSRADQKTKLQTKIDDLNRELKAKLERAKQRSQQEEKESKAKVEALEKKAAKAKGDAKAKIERRIADIKERSKQTHDDFEKLNEDIT